MIAILSAVVLLSSAPVSAPAPKAAVTHWGAEQTLTAEPKPLAKAITEAKSGSTVLVTAKAESVCQQKGCWVVLQDGDASVRVTMKDYGFFLPKDLAGKTLVIEGVLAETVTSVKDQRHYAKDAGKSKDEIAAIKSELKAWSLVASSIRVQE